MYAHVYEYVDAHLCVYVCTYAHAHACTYLQRSTHMTKHVSMQMSMLFAKEDAFLGLGEPAQVREHSSRNTYPFTGSVIVSQTFWGIIDRCCSCATAINDRP